MYYVTGNHDVGWVQVLSLSLPELIHLIYFCSLGVSEYFSENARNRFRHHFGPLNHGVLIGNHTILFIDAPGLVEEDFQRRGHSLDYEQWKPLPNGTVEFVKSVTQGNTLPISIIFIFDGTFSWTDLSDCLVHAHSTLTSWRLILWWPEREGNHSSRNRIRLP